MNAPKPLFEFWKDKPTKNNVQEYLIQFLKEEGAKKMFNREDVSGVAEAKEMIDKAFENMDLLFEAKSTIKKSNSPR